MTRMIHGSTVSLETVQATINAIDAINNAMAAPIMLAAPRRLTEFGYMFKGLQDLDENLLEKNATTVANLIKLGETMRDTSPLDVAGNDPDIPAAYTFLGQFIDHDITLETMSDAFGDMDDPSFLQTSEQVLQRIKNGRTATVDLDSVYDAPAPLFGRFMRLGEVTSNGPVVPKKDLVLRFSVVFANRRKVRQN